MAYTIVVISYHTYKVKFETEPHTKEILAYLPTLNHTADTGKDVEEAIKHLRKLASGFLEVLIDEGEDIPPNDPPGEGVYLTLKVKKSRVALKT